MARQNGDEVPNEKQRERNAEKKRRRRKKLEKKKGLWKVREKKSQKAKSVFVG